MKVLKLTERQNIYSLILQKTQQLSGGVVVVNTRFSRLLCVNLPCEVKPVSSPSAVDLPALFGPTKTTTPFGGGLRVLPLPNSSVSKKVIGVSLATHGTI